MSDINPEDKKISIYDPIYPRVPEDWKILTADKASGEDRRRELINDARGKIEALTRDLRDHPMPAGTLAFQIDRLNGLLNIGEQGAISAEDQVWLLWRVIDDLDLRLDRLTARIVRLENKLEAGK